MACDNGTMTRIKIEAVLLIAPLLAVLFLVGLAAIWAFDQRTPEVVLERVITTPVVAPGGSLYVQAKFEVMRPGCDFQNQISTANGYVHRLSEKPWRKLSPTGVKGVVNVAGRIPVPESLPDGPAELVYQTFFICNPWHRLVAPLAGPVERYPFMVSSEGRQ